VVGVGVAVTSRDDPGSTAADSGSRSGAPAPRGFLGDVGDVTDPAALRALLGTGSVAKAPEGAASSTAPAAGASNLDVQRSARPGSEQVSACADRIAAGAPVRFSATATFGGSPAIVVAVTRSGRTIVFVAAAGDCRDILGSVSR
jgi:hypothetical protein